MAEEKRLPFTISYLASVSPTSTSRAWLTAPHPYLPWIATASSDKTVRIQSLKSFGLVTTLAGHKRSVRACAWRPGLKGDKESYLATGSFDANAGIWAARNDHADTEAAGDQRMHGGIDDDDEEEDDDWFRYDVVLEGHDSEVKSVSWSCNGAFVATCSRDKSIWVWEAMDQAPAGAMSTNGRLGAGGLDADGDNYETVAVLQEHEGDVKCVAFHPTEETCLASSSYDETIRIWREDLDQEWSCVGLCEGHTGTVWTIAWEPPPRSGGLANGTAIRAADDEEDYDLSGPRIISCSDDHTIRVWKRKPKERPALPTTSGPRIPSIIRTTGDEEEWYQSDVLPQRHERAVFAVSWSAQSKRVVSAGSDGKIVVYEESPASKEDIVMSDTGEEIRQTNGQTVGKPSAWKVVAEFEPAHGVFEVNHVCWAKRYDAGKRSDDEEVIVSTGDDGEIKVWTLDSS